MGRFLIETSETRNSLYFTAPHEIEIRREEIAEPPAHSLHIQSISSLISAGTEMLLFRGKAPQDLTADDVLPALSGSLKYPLKFGYSAVGKILTSPDLADQEIVGKHVFAFNPHEDSFFAEHNSDLIVPQKCSIQDALFLANMETAVNIVLDAEVRIGEKIIVLGQGVVGLLTTALLAQYPLQELITFDLHTVRRSASLEMGALGTFDPNNAEELKKVKKRLGKVGADTVIELSGHPRTLDLALGLVGRQGKIVVGSWYGLRRAELDLGTGFHRGRIKMISSHVSSIDPALSGRWDRSRRFSLAWKMLAKIQPSKLITHRFPFAEASKAYDFIDAYPEDSIGVVLDYELPSN